jgi:hypothetical protein
MQGAFISDLSPSRNDAAFTNPSWSLDSLGTIAALSGSTGYGIVQDAPSHRVSEVSLTIWFRRHGNQARYNCLASKMFNNEDNPPYVNYGFEWRDGNVFMDISPNGNFYQSAAVDISDLTWVVLTGTYSMTLGAKIYRNGNLMWSDPGITGPISNYASTNNWFCIGGGGDGCTVSNVDFAGVLLHNRALQDSEVSKLAQNPLLPFYRKSQEVIRGVQKSYSHWWNQPNQQIIGGGIAA